MGEQTGHQCRVPTRWTKQHTEATRRWPLVGLARNVRDQLRTPSVRTVSTNPQLQIARAPPPWRTWHFAQTQARRGGAPQRDSPETRAGSETREATPDTPQRAAEWGTSPDRHNRDDDSFDAFMESCRPHAVPAPAAPRGHPEPRRDQAEDTPLTASRQAPVQRD